MIKDCVTISQKEYLALKARAEYAKASADLYKGALESAKDFLQDIPDALQSFQSDMALEAINEALRAED